QLGDRAALADALTRERIVPGTLAVGLAQPLEVGAGPGFPDVLHEGIARHAYDGAPVDLEREPLATRHRVAPVPRHDHPAEGVGARELAGRHLPPAGGLPLVLRASPSCANSSGFFRAPTLPLVFIMTSGKPRPAASRTKETMRGCMDGSPR